MTHTQVNGTRKMLLLIHMELDLGQIIVSLSSLSISADVKSLSDSQVNGTRKLLDFMLDNLAISTTPPPPRPWIQLAPLDRNKTMFGEVGSCFICCAIRYKSLHKVDKILYAT